MGHCTVYTDVIVFVCMLICLDCEGPDEVENLYISLDVTAAILCSTLNSTKLGV